MNNTTTTTTTKNKEKKKSPTNNPRDNHNRHSWFAQTAPGPFHRKTEETHTIKCTWLHQYSTYQPPCHTQWLREPLEQHNQEYLFSRHVCKKRVLKHKSNISIPHAVCIITFVLMIFDNPKSAIFTSVSKSRDASNKFSGFKSLPKTHVQIETRKQHSLLFYRWQISKSCK